MIDILSMGEVLIDFTPYSGAKGEDVFKQNAGGAPANVAVQTALLGAKSAFIGKVGNDNFGKFLKDTLEKYKVSTKGLVVDDEALTTLAFVHLGKNGERDFTFYRKPGADTLLRYDEVDLSLVDECRIFHFGSISMTCEPSRSTTLSLLELAKEKGKIISYDPNYRPMLWESASKAKTAMKSVLPFVDIIKVSEDELKILTDCDQFLQGIAKLLGYGIKIAVVTQGAKGCIIAGNGGIERLPTYSVTTVDTTGSGDSFFGAFLFKVAESQKLPGEINFSQLKEFADFANASGALCSTKYGAIPAMPSLEEIEDCMRNVSKLN